MNTQIGSLVRKGAVAGMLAVSALLPVGAANAYTNRAPAARNAAPAVRSGNRVQVNIGVRAAAASVVPVNYWVPRPVAVETGQAQYVNETPWKVLLYLNNTYIGTVLPGYTFHYNVVAGYYTLSAKAFFDDGSNRSWDPMTEYLGSFQYIIS